MVKGTIVAHVPIDVPTINLVRGIIEIARIIKGKERRALTIGLNVL